MTKSSEDFFELFCSYVITKMSKQAINQQEKVCVDVEYDWQKIDKYVKDSDRKL